MTQRSNDCLAANLHTLRCLTCMKDANSMGNMNEYFNGYALWLVEIQCMSWVKIRLSNSCSLLRQ
jgi:hypothetical protein